MEKITFRTRSGQSIEVAGRKIGTLSGWVEHTAEATPELADELGTLVDDGIATVQLHHPRKGWSPDLTAEQLDELRAGFPSAEAEDGDDGDTKTPAKGKKAKADPEPEPQPNS